MGERRWRASQQAGLAAVPAIVRETAEDDLLRDALLENLHRSQLNPLEEAAAYQQLLDDFGCTHDELAARIGRSRPQISNTLRLLRLPPLVQRRVAAGVLSAGHARALLGLDDSAAMERLAQRIVAEGLSVRSVEEIVAVGEEHAVRPPAGRGPATGWPSWTTWQRGCPTGWTPGSRSPSGRRKGRLTVEFATVDDLQRIVQQIAPGEDGPFPANHVDAPTTVVCRQLCRIAKSPVRQRISCPLQTIARRQAEAAAAQSAGPSRAGLSAVPWSCSRRRPIFQGPVPSARSEQTCTSSGPLWVGCCWARPSASWSPCCGPANARRTPRGRPV